MSTGLKTLASPGAVQSLTGLLRVQFINSISISRVEMTEVETSQDDAIAIAEGLGMSPLSTVRHFPGALDIFSVPEMKRTWENGGRHLELGCGVGNNLFHLLIDYPRVTAVGVEIDRRTTEEARRRADLLGLSNRVELRNMDAADIEDDGAFDTAQWNQFFFPESCRSGVLRALFKALKPRAYVCIPVLPPVSGVWEYRWYMLGMAFKALMLAPAMSLAELAGVRPATANYAETGKHRPSPLTRRKLAAALSTPLDKIDFEVRWVWNIPPSG